MIIKAYKYDTEAEATAAIDAINNHFGVPVSEIAITITYTKYQYYNSIWYIAYLPEIENLLGTPSEIEIIDNEI